MLPEDVQVVIYHMPCTDGFASAFTAWKFTPTIKLIPLRNDEDLYDEASLMGQNVLFLDICKNGPTMAYYRSLAKKLMVLDHHLSAKAHIDGVEGFFYDDNHSACMMAWQYFFPTAEVPLFLELIEKYDTGKTDEQAHVFAFYAFYGYPFHLRLWDKFMDRQFVLDCIDKGKENYAFEIHNVHVEKRRALRKVFNGYNVRVLNTTSRVVSELGAEIAKDCDFAMLWFYNHWTNSCKVTLRSSGQIDVSKIALGYGGGGHRLAASFHLPLQLLMNSLYG